MEFKIVEPCRRKITGKKEENDVRDIFHGHWETMKKQTETVMNRINTWRSRRINDINKYADDQIHQLEAIYNHQRDIFDRERDEKISIAKNFHQSKSNSSSTVDDTFNGLCNTWRLLEYQVAQLENIQYEVQYPRVVAIGDQTKGNVQNQSSTYADRSQDRRIKSMTNETSVTEKYESNSSKSPLQPPYNGTGEQPSSNSFPKANNRSKSSSNNSKPAITDVFDSNNKCPICFMIFPLYMSDNDRHQHFEEHMIDNKDADVTTL